MCTYMSKCLQVVMVHRNSVFNFLSQQWPLGTEAWPGLPFLRQVLMLTFLTPAAQLLVVLSLSVPACSKGRADSQWVFPWWSDHRPHRHSPVLGTFSYLGWKPVLFLSCPTRLTRDVSFVIELPVLGLGLQKPDVCCPFQRTATLRRASWAHVPMLAAENKSVWCLQRAGHGAASFQSSSHSLVGAGLGSRVGLL